MVIDRENAPAKASGEVESVFVISCSAAEAEEILELALIGIVNETTGELGVINDYTSTKEADIRVETMNIPYHVLGLVPIINNYENDKQGSMPMEAGEWWAKKSEEVINAVVGFFVKLGETIVSIVAKVVDAVVKVVAKVIEAIVAVIMWLIELLLKAILLVMIWIMFALTLLYFLAMFAVLISVFFLVALFLDANAIIEADSLTLQKGNVVLAYKYRIGLDHYDRLDLEIPTIFTTYESDMYVFETKENYGVSMGVFPIEMLIAIALILAPPTTTELQTSVDSPKTSNLKTAEINIIDYILDIESDFWEGYFLSGDLAAILAAALGAIAMGIDSSKQAAALGLGFLITITASIGFLLQVFTDIGSISFPFILGFILGPIMSCIFSSGIAAFAALIKGDKKTDNMKKLILALEIFDWISLGIGAFSVIVQLFESIYDKEIEFLDFMDYFFINIVIYSVGIIFGGIGMGIDENLKQVLLIFTISSIAMTIMGLFILAVKLSS